jgi:hypothetical protein
MVAEHNRPEGLGQGYFCLRCGQSGLNMYGMGGKDHPGMGRNTCEPNPELVAELRRLNQ